MTDHRMEHGSHKAEKPQEETGEPQERAPRTEPAEPQSITHQPLEEIPANEGGKGSIP